MVSVYSAVLYCNILSWIVWAWVTVIAVTACKTFSAVMTSYCDGFLIPGLLGIAWNNENMATYHCFIALTRDSWPSEASSTCQANSIFYKTWSGNEAAQFSFKVKIFVNVHFFSWPWKPIECHQHSSHKTGVLKCNPQSIRPKTFK